MRSRCREHGGTEPQRSGTASMHRKACCPPAGYQLEHLPRSGSRSSGDLNIPSHRCPDEGSRQPRPTETRCRLSAMTVLGRVVVAASLSAAQAIKPAFTVPTFEDVMVAPNDSHENGTYVNYLRGRLFVQNSTL